MSRAARGTPARAEGGLPYDELPPHIACEALARAGLCSRRHRCASTRVTSGESSTFPGSVWQGSAPRTRTSGAPRQGTPGAALLEARCIFGAPRVLVGFRNLGIDSESHTVPWTLRLRRRGMGRSVTTTSFISSSAGIARMCWMPPCRSTSRSSGTIRRERVLLYNAACAITFLAFRLGTHPEQRWCGRTLEQDPRWSRTRLPGYAAPGAAMLRGDTMPPCTGRRRPRIRAASSA